jgi:menaquinone-9 beta-reductase
MYETDVFVIGGGPAGLAAALAVRRKGLRVSVADSARPPLDKACGEGLMPDSVAALGALGVSHEAFESHAFRGVRFLESGTSAEADFPAGRGLGVRRIALHAALADAASRAGVGMHWGARVTDISNGDVAVDGAVVRARWVVGADGSHSRVRHWAGLHAVRSESRRFGFRRHYNVAPWSEFIELHWGTGAQIYVTPVGAAEVCVALITGDPHLRLDEALQRFPAVRRRLGAAAASSPERGAVTVSRRLRSVARGNVALIGDASGSVDAITGEGLRLSFQQALALADALEREDLAVYQAAHARLARRPALMSAFMLAFDRHPRLRRRTLAALARRPDIFAGMLAMHVGELPAARCASAGATLAWEMLIA